MKKLLMLPPLVLLGACASIVEGTDQSITVSSNPTKASCFLERDGAQIGAVDPTPGTVQVEKNSADITVMCSKAGYDDGSAVLVSGFEGWALGNLVFGGIVGAGVDAVTGAINSYPPSITVTLPRK